MSADVAIIGAGLAGLSCARELSRAGVGVQVFEASDGVGGRVRTDVVEGFRLDRGFQVLLTAYPECRRTLDYTALDLKSFYPGALVRFEGRFHRLGDPWRSPSSSLPTLLSPIGSLADKFRMARLRMALAQYSVEDLFDRQEMSTRERLAHSGFSAGMIDRFFRPFFGGIFLEAELKTSSRMFDFVFRMLADGDTAIPRYGMSAIPEQIASSLPAGTIQLNRRVSDLREVQARALVIAAEGPEAARLLRASKAPASRGVWCYYFAADEPPNRENSLFLNGDGTGPINNCCILTNVSADYGPDSATLISASVLSSAGRHGVGDVRAQLQEWFGFSATRWKFLRSYFVSHAQPEQNPGTLQPPSRTVRLQSGLFLCGDHRENASINGAMVSGRRAADAILAEWR